MSKEAMKLALARLQARTDTADLDAIAALNEALAEQPAPGRTHYEDGDVFERIAARSRKPSGAAAIAKQEPVGTVQCINGITIGYLYVMQPVGTKLYTSPQPAQRKPLTDANAQFNAAIDFAIEEGTGAAEFLRCWREGNTSEWPEFEAAHGIKENT